MQVLHLAESFPTNEVLSSEEYLLSSLPTVPTDLSVPSPLLENSIEAPGNILGKVLRYIEYTNHDRRSQIIFFFK